MSSALAPTELRGFLLTRHWRDLPDGTEIEYWLATGEGPKKVLLTRQTSVAFLPVRHWAATQATRAILQGLEVKKLDLKTFDQEPVIGVYARRFRDLGKLARALQPLGIPLYEADVRPHDRYLMERFITAGVLVEAGQREGSTILDGRLKPASGWRPALKVVSLDIETSATEELYSIALDGAGDRVVFMLGEAPVPASAPVALPTDFRLVYCPTRRDMVEQLNAWFEAHDPDVIVGWNVIQFDLRVLQKAADASSEQLLLGRERRPIAWRTHPGRQGYLFAPMPGRVVVDGIEALRAGMWSFPSFSLEAVSQKLLGEGKEIGDAYDKMAEIEQRYQEDKPALASYNIRDCALVLRIFDKLELLPFVLERAQTTGLQVDHFGGSIAAFISELAVEALDVAVLHGLARLNQDVPNPVLVRPGQERPTGELRAIVRSHCCRIATEPCHLVEHAGDVLARDAVVHRDVHGLLAEVIHHRQALDAPSTGQAVRDEIHAQHLVDVPGQLQRHTLLRWPFGFAALLHCQVGLPVQPIDALVVHPRKLLAQHVVDAPVAESAAHQGRLPNLFTQGGVELAGLRWVAVAVSG